MGGKRNGMTLNTIASISKNFETLTCKLSICGHILKSCRNVLNNFSDEKIFISPFFTGLSFT